MVESLLDKKLKSSRFDEQLDVFRLAQTGELRPLDALAETGYIKPVEE